MALSHITLHTLIQHSHCVSRIQGGNKDYIAYTVFADLSYSPFICLKFLMARFNPTNTLYGDTVYKRKSEQYKGERIVMHYNYCSV